MTQQRADALRLLQELQQLALWRAEGIQEAVVAVTELAAADAEKAIELRLQQQQREGLEVLVNLKVEHEAKREEARAEGFDNARMLGQLEREAALAEQLEGYRQGLVDDGRCAAPAEGYAYQGEPVRCQLPAGHPLGPLDRHKAITGPPHVAVSWNEPGTER